MDNLADKILDRIVIPVSLASMVLWFILYVWQWYHA